MRDIEKLTAKIASEITDNLWEIGGEPDSPLLRIAFIGKHCFCGHERQMGGFGKEPFKNFIKNSILVALVANQKVVDKNRN